MAAPISASHSSSRRVTYTIGAPLHYTLSKRAAWLASVLVLTISALSPLFATAQAATSTHSLTLGNSVESVDADGRRVFVTTVTGDLPGVLTLALVVNADGTVTGGEWALNVSYIQFGPPDADGDGDPSESLVQRGVIKGAVSGGSAVLGAKSLASVLSGIRLDVTGATLEFAAIKAGNGTVMGNNMDQQAASSGLLSLTF